MTFRKPLSYRLRRGRRFLMPMERGICMSGLFNKSIVVGILIGLIVMFP